MVREYKKHDRVQLTEHFSTPEFKCKGKLCCSKIKIDDTLVEFLELIRQHFNEPVTVNSGYRCETHNSKVGGATGSLHVQGKAADISVKNVTPLEVAQYAESIGVCGIGLYETTEDGYFVHIDTRGKSQKAFWYGQSEEPRETFQPKTKEKWFRVVVGTCRLRSSAEVIQKQAWENGFPGAYIMESE